jgi:hypothetical protein
LSKAFRGAAEELLPLVYDELRKLAAQKMAQEKPGQTLQATALVHDAYVRLVASGDGAGSDKPHWDNRRHFFAAAAEAMLNPPLDRWPQVAPAEIVIPRRRVEAAALVQVNPGIRAGATALLLDPCLRCGLVRVSLVGLRIGGSPRVF